MVKEITGMHIYYYFVCQRKLWYFYNNINMEQNSELVALGKIIDESSYKNKGNSIVIDNTIQIDFIDKKNVILNEVKKSKAIEEAGIWQLKYYLYYLEKRGIENVKGKIDYPLLRETKEILLEDNDRDLLENIIKNIEDIVLFDNIPIKIESKICKKCAYYDLCYA